MSPLPRLRRRWHNTAAPLPPPARVRGIASALAPRGDRRRERARRREIDAGTRRTIVRAIRSIALDTPKLNSR
eukprot:31028-Pelagococcus_subviridis.AAC.2